MPVLPTSTVTFLFTDIEGSTKLAQHFPHAWPAALTRHEAILREAVTSHHGHLFRIVGDECDAAFAAARDALAAALAAQRALRAEPWGEIGSIRVRMGLHTGEAEVNMLDDDGHSYKGYLTLTRTHRIMSAGHGGQVLLSQPTYELVQDYLPDGVMLRDLSERRLKDLVRPEHLYQLVTADLPSDFPPLKTLDVLPNNLPVQLTSFVGREREMAEVKRLLALTHLLTLTGPGGTGKTRLALQVAADMLDHFADGVWLVELAPLADPARVPQTVASVLGVREEPNRPLLDTLADYLDPKPLLLIFDNCEHLIEACAHVAEQLLRTCLHLQILATSREALGIGGESTFLVPSLSLPSPNAPPAYESLSQYEAVRLFIDRALAVKSDFQVTNTNAPAVAEICHRLDGIPLALELAAARVKVMTVEQIAARLANRFRFLIGGSRTALPRQQTLRALIDWSYDLLSGEERVVFRRLAVFVGDWTLDAAEFVCGSTDAQGEDDHATFDALNLLTHLVDKSLVTTKERDHDEMRYDMLETIREYAREKLEQSDEPARIRARHLAFFLAFAEEAAPKLSGADQVPWLNRIESEHDNLRAAIEWTMASGEVEAALRLASALRYFWYVRGYHSEGREHLLTVLSHPGTRRYPFLRAKTLNAAAYLHSIQAQNAEAQVLLTEALQIGREHDDQHGVAFSLRYLGTVANAQGDYRAARTYLEESLALYRALGDPNDIALSLMYLADVFMYLNEYARAQALYEESASLLRQWMNKNVLPYPLRRIGFLLLARGETVRAAERFRESLMLNKEVGERQGMAASLVGFAILSIAQGQLTRAAQLLGAAELQLGLIHTQFLPTDRAQYEYALIALYAQLAAEVIEAERCAGRALTIEKAIELALGDR